MVWHKIKKALGFDGPTAESLDGESSIHRMVNQNHLNKRKNVRINYPHFGAGSHYPHVLYMGSELNVNNISLGGLLIIDDTEQFGSEIGEVINLEFVWTDLTSKIRARVVGANLQRRHIQFVDFNAQIFLRISQLVKSGHVGQRFHRVRNDSGTLQAEEMWLGPTGETLVFPTVTTAAELSYDKEKILIKKGSPTCHAGSRKPVPVSRLHDALILLANFPQLTPRVKELVEVLNAEILTLEPHGSKRTGSHG